MQLSGLKGVEIIGLFEGL